MVEEKNGYGNIVSKSFRTLEKKGIVKPILAMEGMDFFNSFWGIGNNPNDVILKELARVCLTTHKQDLKQFERILDSKFAWDNNEGITAIEHYKAMVKKEMKGLLKDVIQ